ncbi:MAG: metal ABC transporter solute-binding protein, Zn/Mn family [Cyclobacteriaceae bacterium]
MRLNHKIIFSLAFICLILGSCTPDKSAKNGKITIVTTTGMIRDAAERVAGAAADVTSLIGPGVDPHLYKASQGDLIKLTNADIIFYNGLHLEGKMGEVLEKLGRLKPVIAVTRDIPDTLLRTAPGFAGAHDPHIWFDVSLWKNSVITIQEELSGRYPVYDSVFRSNAAKHLQELDSLHREVFEHFSKVPSERRVLITAHDAFGYFGDAYKTEVRGLQGISTLSEFGLRDVTDLVNFIVERKIKAIFIESSVSPKSIRAVIEGCRKKNWEVTIGGTLYSDAMGPEGTPEGTYPGMVRANVKTIIEALK